MLAQDKVLVENTNTKHIKIKVKPQFCPDGVSPFDTVVWEKRTAVITSEDGKVLFEQTNCEVPKNWSQLAVNVIVSKYFYGEINTPSREGSVKQLIHRVAHAITEWGKKQNYFYDDESANNFYKELVWLCLHQYACFNSPVWFNVGLYEVYGVKGTPCNYRYNPIEGKVELTENPYEKPQASACFIQSVGDTMEDIMRLATSEALLFKYGSGTGTDLSTLRASCEKLSGGGKPSGPLSFMRVYDQIAAVVKSGGKTRRAAKMQSLKVWHPDILNFIECKWREERKAHALINQGYESNFNGEAYSSILYQNANLSVRVDDDFMRAVEADSVWNTHWVTDPTQKGPQYRARDILNKMAECAWACGDPGIQYDTTINTWHTCPHSGSINASNPCSEYMFLDNTACNLASLNLMKFRLSDGTFDVQSYKSAIRIMFIAQEILVGNSSYPTPEIAENSYKFRPLGLGYSNLGSYLMSCGVAYDSNKARAICGALTAIMHGAANATSIELAAAVGPFEGYKENRIPMLAIMEKHRDQVFEISNECPEYLKSSAFDIWREVCAGGPQIGFRNAQATVLAPTGTISFMMDCDTTGIEPEIALVKYKQLAGGGMLKIVNQMVSTSLITLGYSEHAIDSIIHFIHDNDTIEGCPDLKPEHRSVFDCAFKPKNGTRSIRWEAHVDMMAAAQPFLSGAISKTVNMPNDSTVKDIADAYMKGWKKGLKALAIYRDGSKGSQPLSTSLESEGKKEKIVEKPKRKRLPETRDSVTHKFQIGGHEGYITVGKYEDGTPGEMFVVMSKEGSTIGGLMDTIGTLTSICFQYGVPPEVLIQKFENTRFEPQGFTTNKDIRTTTSVVDYIYRWLGNTFIPGYKEKRVYANAEASLEKKSKKGVQDEIQSDGPPCDSCGTLTIRSGNCYLCHNCGISQGCG